MRTARVRDNGDGFVSAKLIQERADVSQVTDIYVCGPKPMRQAIEVPLVKATGASFHAEHFLFRRR